MIPGAIPAGTPVTAVQTDRKPPLSRRPRDAASILLIDRSGPFMRVLVGKRSKGHVFMPDLHVFPGGRRDRGDHRLRFCADMHPLVLEKMTLRSGARVNAARMRALGLAALRELHEEAGLAIGEPVPHSGARLSFMPDLSSLRYVARAITPPGNIRRFDTRFFASFTDENRVNADNLRDSAELVDLRWLNMNDVSDVEMPDITKMILNDLNECLKSDPALPFGMPVPFYYARHGRFVRDLI